MVTYDVSRSTAHTLRKKFTSEFKWHAAKQNTRCKKVSMKSVQMLVGLKTH